MIAPRNYYKRNLPHWYPAGKSIFLTWRLYGSLPQSVINWLRMARQHLRKPELSSEERLLEVKKLFAKVDSLLDRATSGPVWLKNAEIASLIQAALLERYAYLYTLWA
jgi:putative transposase